MNDELLRIARSLHDVANDIDRLMEQPELKSAHEPGEPFNDKWEYAGKLRVPVIGDGLRWVYLDGDINFISGGQVNIFINNGLREILRPRTIRRNAEPVKSKPKLPRIKVETWNKNSEHSEYYFSGDVDWKRLVKETFGEMKAEVVRVTAVKGKMNFYIGEGKFEGKSWLLANRKIDKGWTFCISPLDGYWWEMSNSAIKTDADIVAAIRKHNKPAEPKYKVGDVVELKGSDGLPDGEYKILDDRLPRIGDCYLSKCEYGIETAFKEATEDWKNVKCFIVAPMSLDWYDFEIEGVKCRAYVNEYGGRVYTAVGCDDYLEYTNSKRFADNIILDAVDARMKRELGHGIIAVPYAVSKGNFEAPKGEGK